MVICDEKAIFLCGVLCADKGVTEFDDVPVGAFFGCIIIREGEKNVCLCIWMENNYL